MFYFPFIPSTFDLTLCFFQVLNWVLKTCFFGNSRSGDPSALYFAINVYITIGKKWASNLNCNLSIPPNKKTTTMKLFRLSEKHWWWKQTNYPSDTTDIIYEGIYITPFLEVITPVTRWFSGIDRVYWLAPFVSILVFRGPFKKTCVA